ncbi:cytochrome P450 2U1 [Aplysia californica]|uniref:Cytochrome P450 2U1 n=1 Tax=Aplysia californica TaxID=6500 RepID=A0ABM0JUD1_APLCA|nr:cytochrome P450 2U1 [Aplysia californica]XP_035826490.1 cytochrome P450 2U1 [Aplysia californica]
MSFFVTLVSDNLVTIAIFLLVLLLARRLRPRPGLPPGPRGWPFVGNLFLLMKPDKREVFRKLRQKYGDLVSLSVGGQPILLVNGVDKLHEVFVDHGKEFDKRPQVFTVLKVGQGKAVVHSSGHVWKEHRGFVLSNMKELGIGKTTFQQNVVEEIKPFLDVLDSTKGDDFDPRFCVQTAMSNIICSICFGKRFEYEDPDFKDILNIFDENMRISGSTSIVNYFPFLENLPGDPFKCGACLDNVDKIQVILKRWIERHRKTLDPSKPRDIIDRYILELETKRKTGEATTMDETQLLKLVGDLFVGGTETTATTLRWALLFLVRHPEMQQRIYEEVISTLKGRTQLSILDKKGMPFTSAAILEIQRLGDIAPFVLPHSNFEEVTLGKYTIPAGCVVIPNVNSVHHDPDIWEHPLEFRPSRFLDNNGSVVNRKELMPFFIGPRMCPGKSLAKMEVFLFLTSIIQHFEILPTDSERLPALEGHVGITYVPHPHSLRFVKRRH